MANANADNVHAPSQAYTPPVDVQRSLENRSQGFSYENPSKFDFGFLQHESLQEPDHSSQYNSALFYPNASESHLGGQASWLEPASSLSQTFTVPFAPVDMNAADHVPESDYHPDLTQVPFPISEVPLRCNEPGCDTQRVYSNASSFRKHQGKHARPYACKHSSCNYRRFGDRAGLTRHLREVHGTEFHYCPFVSCNRHARGFPRKYNLIQHQKRCHSDQSICCHRKASNHFSIETVEHDNSLTEPPKSPTSDGGQDSETDTQSTGEEGCSKGEDMIKKKLQALKARRAETIREYDRKIASLEHALSVMEENSD